MACPQGGVAHGGVDVDRRDVSAAYASSLQNQNLRVLFPVVEPFLRPRAFARRNTSLSGTKARIRTAKVDIPAEAQKRVRQV